MTIAPFVSAYEFLYEFSFPILVIVQIQVRLAFGLKNIKHEVRFLANDDVDTPTSLVGKKVVPIFQFESQKGKEIMPESLDIIAKVDADPTFGPVGTFKPLSKREDWAQWQAKHAELLRELQRSRYVQTVLPEFYSIDGKDAFVRNHPLAPYTKVLIIVHPAFGILNSNVDRVARSNQRRAMETLHRCLLLISEENC